MGAQTLKRKSTAIYGGLGACSPRKIFNSQGVFSRPSHSTALFCVYWNVYTLVNWWGSASFFKRERGEFEPTMPPLFLHLWNIFVIISYIHTYTYRILEDSHSRVLTLWYLSLIQYRDSVAQLLLATIAIFRDSFLRCVNLILLLFLPTTPASNHNTHCCDDKNNHQPKSKLNYE